MIKHMILTSGRSGSNYLSNLLNNHPYVVNYGEVLGPWTTGYKVNQFPGFGLGDAGAYLDFIYEGSTYFHLARSFARLKSRTGRGPRLELEGKLWRDIQSFGVKDFSMNLINRGVPTYLDDHADIQVISLYRENALRRYISLVLLGDTGLVSSAHIERLGGGRRQNHQVCLDPDQFLEGISTTESVVQDQLDMVARLDPSRVLSIRYEDLFESQRSQQDYAQRVCDFLGVEQVHFESKHSKLNSDNLRELISNYDEIFELCQGTPREKYFYY